MCFIIGQTVRDSGLLPLLLQELQQLQSDWDDVNRPFDTWLTPRVGRLLIFVLVLGVLLLLLLPPLVLPAGDCFQVITFSLVVDGYAVSRVDITVHMFVLLLLLHLTFCWCCQLCLTT
jgi:hypothetical protein